MADMRLVITGAAGRMGRTLVRVVAQTSGVAVAAALERAGAPELGADAGVLAGLAPLGVALTGNPAVALAGADGILDFTTPDTSVALAERAAAAGLVHIIGTTGFVAGQEAAIGAAAARTAIVKSGNMSLGVNLLMALVARATAALGQDFDVEVTEMHHRGKVDAPSGTALMLGRAIADARGSDFDGVAVHGRQGRTGARPEDAIGLHALRGGSVVGDHAVTFAGEGERIELIHRAEDRSIFARGAVRAALWARGKPPGLYSMADVLGLTG